MKTFYKKWPTLFSVFILSLIFSFLLVDKTYAATAQLSGSVKNSSGVGISGSLVSVIDPNSNSSIVDVNTDSSGNYNAIVNTGIYNIRVTPPSSSNLSSAVVLNQNINQDTVLNFILVNAGTVELSGTFFDSEGNGVSNLEIDLMTPSLVVQTITTDSSGNYSFSAAPATNYLIRTHSEAFNIAGAVPQFFSFNTKIFALNESISNMNFTIPSHEVNVHVQDQTGAPVQNVDITSDAPDTINFSLGALNANGQSSFRSLKTDSNGNVTARLYSNTYTFFVTPPLNSNYSPATIIDNNTENEPFVIILQTPLNISGKLIDINGNGVGDVTLDLMTPSQVVQTVITDSNGNYSFQAGPANNYSIRTRGDAVNVLGDVPQSFNFNTKTFLLDQDIQNFNLTLPFKEVNVHVQDSSGNSIANVGIGTNSPNILNFPVSSTLNANGQSQIRTLHTNSSGNIKAYLFSNTYEFFITPPSGSNYTPVTISGKNIATEPSFTVTLQTPYVLSGKLLDGEGLGIGGVSIDLMTPSQVVQTITTDSNGNYSFTAAPANNYSIRTHGNASNISGHVPQDFTFNTQTFVLDDNKTDFDLNLPLKRVVFHVQDPLDAPVSDVEIGTNGPVIFNFNINESITANGQSRISNLSTDENGNITAYLFANVYDYFVTPPANSIYQTFTLDNQAITGNQTEIISLQYNHATPNTSISLSPDPVSANTYSNPVTVTISSIAASGYSIANIYYTVDGGSQQTYTNPINVSGISEHTITYWSVDNSGVQETPKTKTFTIAPTYNLSGIVYVDSNQNGVQDMGENGYSGASLSLDTGETTTTNINGNYIFATLAAGSYTVTVTAPSGYMLTTTNPVSLPLTANTTANFGIVLAPTATPIPTSTPLPTATPTPTNTPTPTPTNTPTPTVTPRQLTSLSPAKVWMSKAVGDLGLKVDVLAEVYKDNTLVSSGQLNSVTVGSGLFINADLLTIPFNSFSPVTFPTGSQLKVKVSARNACSGSLRNAGTARLWFNDAQANSRFDATIASNNNYYYLRNGFVLNTNVGTGSRQNITVQAGTQCSAFKSFGTWTVTP